MIEIETVLCPVDLTPLSERAVQLAAEVAKKMRARLVLEHNLDSRPPGYLGVSWMWSEEEEEAEQKRGAEAEQKLRELLAGIPKELSPEAKMTRGPVDTAVLHMAAELPAGLIVMGTHGPSRPDHKSLTERIILQATCPVLTLGEGYEPSGVLEALQATRAEELVVLVPIDFTARSRTALDYGIALAERMPHRMHLVHAVKPGKAAQAAIERERERLRELVPEALADRMSTEVKAAEPAAAILAAADETGAIFILMSAHGKSAFQRLLFGTKTMSILRGSDCPVLFLPPRMQIAA